MTVIVHQPANADLQRWFQHIESAYEPTIHMGLDRIQPVWQRLQRQLPAMAVPVITVTGTNGKGSCIESLNALYSAAGYRTACYTSPHIWSFNERMRVNQQVISDETLLQCFEQVEQAREAVPLTFFEFTTLAAFCWFAQQAVDVWLLEVGLGGRLDAVNIIVNTVSIITSIALDHQAYLGNTREAVAKEKAGIIAPNSTVICGDPSPPEIIAQTAAQQRARYLCWHKDFSASEVVSGQVQCLWADTQMMFSRPAVRVDNLCCALQAVHCLQSVLPVSSDQITRAVPTIDLPARQQLIAGQPRVLLDVAHNVAAVTALATRISTLKAKGQRCVAVFSALADKPIVEMLTCLKPWVDTWYVSALAVPRAATQKELHLACEQLELSFRACDSISAAVDAAYRDVGPEDLVVVLGSFYTIAAIDPNRFLSY